ncbi:Ribosomal protein L35 [Thermodesulfatator indicus DSM 15286]|uniref:Ribosomal protein L35 n=1 Tax=Thermodesulfatator indicus (strain DSM 15286 / JCM 11887 / CIR29812) TaxID=667014 RepID=F8AC56_THEID|nr:50S ribosomal protein L35 [Thermodesulfatator indicus]AEH44611.1 Ribosomal protein L35 [Thermodesulfatator indicus DSM 15286]
MSIEKVNEKVALNISRNWYICRNEDVSLFANLSLGRILQIYIYEKFYPQANSVANTRNLKNMIKRLGYEWHLRFFHSKALSFKNQKKKQNCDVLLIYDVNNKPMIKNLNLVAQELLKRKISVAAVTIDANIKKQISENLSIYFLSEFYTISMEKNIYKKARSIRKQIKQYKDCLISNFKKSAKLPDKFIEQILKFFDKQVTQTVREIVSARAFLKELSPKIIVSSTDAHKISRMLFLLAQQEGIKTFVIQHGAPIWEYAYVPVTANKIFVWGEESKNWFLERGTPSEKIIVTGCPRYDTLSFVVDNLNMNKIEQFLKSCPNICLFTNPIDLSINFRIIKSFLSLPGHFFKNVFLKIHPSEDMNFYKGILKKFPCGKKVKIIHSVGIPEELRPGDIAIVGNSTVGIEAIAKGLILVNLELRGFPNPIPYQRYDVGIFADEDCLVEAVKSAFKRRCSISTYMQYLDKCKNFLENYLYSLDGKATCRIVDFLEKIFKSEVG